MKNTIFIDPDIRKAETLPASFYKNSETFDLLKEKIFLKSWQWIGDDSLIKKNSASKTVSIFFLIPPTSAFMAWIFLNEKLSNLDLLGFLIATIGVYIATRDK